MVGGGRVRHKPRLIVAVLVVLIIIAARME